MIKGEGSHEVVGKTPKKIREETKSTSIKKIIQR